MLVVNDDLVAYVRLTSGGTVKLYAGDVVPPEADADHVAHLVEVGVLSEPEQNAGQPGGSSSSGKPKK